MSCVPRSSTGCERRFARMDRGHRRRRQAGVADLAERLDTRDWWERLGEAGWYFSNWPIEYGGLGLDPVRASVVNRALGEYKVPRTDNPLGINVAQALLQWGTEEQRRRFLPEIAHQRETWVQLFSEPGAGSDLAGSRPRAVRDGDTWIINGQKVWSSHAERSQWGILLAAPIPTCRSTTASPCSCWTCRGPASTSGRSGR